MSRRKFGKEAHFKYSASSDSAIQAEKKGTSSVALQVPFWATWVGKAPNTLDIDMGLPLFRKLFNFWP